MAVSIRPFEARDLDRVVDIALAAWVPIFGSFEKLLGPDLFPVVYPDWKADKKRQIVSACGGDRPMDVWVAEKDGLVVGFITFRMDHGSGIGVIGNNAVHPDVQAHGIGTRLYELALKRMKEAGMKAAQVGTGGDDSHAPARRAYEKAGFTRGIPGVTYYQTL